MNKETSFTAKVIEIGNSLGVTIPKNDVNLMNIEKGDYIKVTIKKNGDSNDTD